MMRQHKIVLLKYIKGNFWLLLFPLIRSLVMMKFDLYHWLKGSYMDIIVIFVMLGTAYLKWNFIRFELKEKELIVNYGVLVRRISAVPYSSISCIECYRPIHLQLLKAAKITINLSQNSVPEKRKKRYFCLVVSETIYTQIYKIIPQEVERKKKRCNIKKSDVILFSTFFSSAITGGIYVCSILIYGSRVIENNLEEKFSSLTDIAAEVLKISKAISIPFSVIVPGVIAAGWVWSFTRNLLRHIKFEFEWDKNVLCIRKGCFSNWKYYVKNSSINYADLRQNMLMKIFRLMSLNISCNGYENHKRETAMLVPMVAERSAADVLKTIIHDFTLSNITVRPKISYTAAYIWPPLTMVLIIPVCAAVFYRIVPEWQTEIYFFGVMLELPFLYLLAVKFAAVFSTGVGAGGDSLTISYCKGYKFHRVIVRKEQIAYIKIRRNFFQRANGCCDVIFFTTGESVKAHKVKGIEFRMVEKLLKNVR